jgi:hypothetical protein
MSESFGKRLREEVEVVLAEKKRAGQDYMFRHPFIVPEVRFCEFVTDKVQPVLLSIAKNGATEAEVRFGQCTGYLNITQTEAPINKTSRVDITLEFEPLKEWLDETDEQAQTYAEEIWRAKCACISRVGRCILAAIREYCKDVEVEEQVCVWVLRWREFIPTQ